VVCMMMQEMDHAHIGTDATIAEHIATVQKRNYAQKVTAGP
jgi:DNA topoisomerase IA